VAEDHVRCATEGFIGPVVLIRANKHISVAIVVHVAGTADAVSALITQGSAKYTKSAAS
jgi:hypothetical protein